jgi:hypothetical protein
MGDKMDISEVGKYIINNYPESSLASNEKDYEYYEGELLNECHNFFTFYCMGICGCGDPDCVELKIRVYLHIVETYWNKKEGEFKEAHDREKDSLQKYFGVSDIYENPLLLFMVYMLNDKKILEHNGSIGGSYLTELGKMYLYILDNVKLEKE